MTIDVSKYLFWLCFEWISIYEKFDVNAMFLNIGMSKKECENWYIFHSLLYISELRDLNVRNECIWIFLIYSEFVRYYFWITGYKNICIKKYNLKDTSDNLLISRIGISFFVTRQRMIRNICFDYVLNEFPIYEKSMKRLCF